MEVIMNPINQANTEIMRGENTVAAAINQAQTAADNFSKNLETLRNQAGTDPKKIAAFNEEVEQFIEILTEYCDMLTKNQPGRQ